MSNIPSVTNEDSASELTLDAPSLAEHNPRLRAAVDYVKIGLRVIPLYDRRKEPRIMAWPSKATTDPNVVKGWFKEWPESNVGIATGRGLVVLDVDLKKGGQDSLADLMGVHGPVPPTAEARTGSGGTHYFFSVDPSIAVANRTGFEPGLDIRGDGGYVVAAPSIHPLTGNHYEWVTHPEQGMAPIPSWLLSMITTPAKATSERPADKTSNQRRKSKTTRPAERHDGPRRPISGPRARKDPATYNTTSARLPTSSVGQTANASDKEALLVEVLERFPVPGIGHRHNLMNRAIASMVGRGITDETIMQVMLAWFEHFNEQGKIGSDRDTMENELLNCLHSTRNNPDFHPSYNQAFYEAAYAEFELREHVLASIGATVEDLRQAEAGRGERPTAESTAESQYAQSDAHSNCIRVTQSSRIRKRLCESQHERCFIEALLAIVAWKKAHTTETTLKLTNDQLRRVVSKRSRVEMPVWDNTQIVRLKQKYVDRLGLKGEREPATVFELLREQSKGYRGKGRAKGDPSEYELTGIKILLNANAKPETDDQGDHAPSAGQAHAARGRDALEVLGASGSGKEVRQEGVGADRLEPIMRRQLGGRFVAFRQQRITRGIDAERGKVRKPQ
jgi:hypothetical protein